MSEESTAGTHRGKREIIVTHNFETEIDVDKLDQWVDANFPKGSVQVMDLRTREVLYDDF